MRPLSSFQAEWSFSNKTSRYESCSDSGSQIIKANVVNCFSRFIGVCLIDDYTLVINLELGIEAIDVRNPSKRIL
jgi:hypothetical protein